MSINAYKRGLAAQIEQLRTKWPQAHADGPHGSQYGWHLIGIPGILLPKGYNATICTGLFLATITHDGLHMQSPLDGFYVDIPDLRLSTGERPKYSRPLSEDDDETIPMFRQWRQVSRFWWKAQEWDPNRCTLYTAAMLMKRRLDAVQ